MARPKKNNADYFSHDSDMRNDKKIRAIRRKFGNEGYALWCYTLETLTNASNFELKIDDIEVELMAADFDVEPSKMIVFLDYCISIDLLQKPDKKTIICEKLLDRLEPLLSKRNRNKESYRQRKLTEREFQTSEMQINRVSDIENPQSKVKESKVKEKDITKVISKKKSEKRFSPPKKEELAEYFKTKSPSRNCELESERFFDFYESKGWLVGKTKMKDWKSSVRNWIRNSYQTQERDNLLDIYEKLNA
jgi:hypothetical protein